ncbi:U3 small nucleolar RNA-associated protein 6, putative [Plasmodium ovale]|nr:U3 small nucleolar RNA-associated protein 6, putative [Plasmodium ovale]
MINSVCDSLENMVFEFQDLKNKGLFSDNEIKSIWNKRKHHEYAVNSSTSELISFILYLEFEISLNNIREKRKKKKKKELLDEILKYKDIIQKRYSDYVKMKNELENKKCSKKFEKLKKLYNTSENNMNHFKNNILKTEKKLEVLLKYSISDYSLIIRIINIFKRCLKKHYNNIQVWLLYFNFCYLQKRKRELEIAILNSLKYHMKNDLIWIFYLHYFYNIRKNINYTRKLYIRAILFIPQSLSLNILYFTIEFDIFLKLLKTFKEKCDKSNNGLKEFNEFCKISNENDTKNGALQTNDEKTEEGEKEDILKMDIDHSNINTNNGTDNGDQFSIIREEDKYGLDVIIFLGKKYVEIFQNDKANLYIFICILLNVYFKMEKIDWVKNYVLHYTDFKNFIFHSIEMYKQDQPCFNYYLFINKCVQFSKSSFCENNDFLLLKKNFYTNNDQNFNVTKAETYFHVSKVNTLLLELFNSLNNDVKIYLFCLLLTNLFETFNEYTNMSDIFKIDDPNNEKIEHTNTVYHTSPDTAQGKNLHKELNKICSNVNSVEQKNISKNENKKDIFFYMKEPSLRCHENLPIFQFLNDELFLCDNYKFRRINMEYVKEKDKNTYQFLYKLNFMASVCLLENRHSSVSKNNFIYDFEENSKNSDILSSMLYFFLFNKKKLKNNQAEQKLHSVPHQADRANNGEDRKRKNPPESVGQNNDRSKRALSCWRAKKVVNDDENVYESDSDNLSGSSSGSEEGGSSDGGSISEGDESNDGEERSDGEESSDGRSSSKGDERNDGINECGSKNDGGDYSKKDGSREDKARLPNEETLPNREIFIIDELLMLLRRDIGTFAKIATLRCVLNLVTFLNNPQIKDYLRNTIVEEYEKVRKSPQNRLTKNEINNLTCTYKRVYKDERKGNEKNGGI